MQRTSPRGATDGAGGLSDRVRGTVLVGAHEIGTSVDMVSGRSFACGRVAQWLDHSTDDREVACLNPTGAAWKLWQFPLPHFASVFRRRH